MGMRRLAVALWSSQARASCHAAMFIQEALALGTDEGGEGEGGSDVGDLDDYINALDAEVNTK